MKNLLKLRFNVYKRFFLKKGFLWKVLYIQNLMKWSKSCLTNSMCPDITHPIVMLFTFHNQHRWEEKTLQYFNKYETKCAHI